MFCGREVNWTVRAALIAFAASFAFMATPAKADYICASGPGPGEVQTGMTQGGPGIAAMPLCQEDGSSSGSQGGSWGDGVRSLSQSIIEYDRYVSSIPKQPENVWTFNPPENNVCPAFYNGSNGYAVVRLPRTAAAKVKPTLTFWSYDRNRRSEVKPVDLTFENGRTGGKMVTLTVKAWYSLGEYILTLPTNAVLLGGIEDRMTFRLSVAGKTVIDLNWAGGNKAKATLARCLAGAK